MRSSPAVARWLLSAFGCSLKNDAILGDLDEQFQNGRSGGWYWRQTVTAIATGFWREVTAHRLLAVRAFVLAWGLILCAVIVFRPMLGNLFQAFRPMSDLGVALTLILGVAISSIAGAGIGWVVARLHRPFQKAAVMLYILSFYAMIIPAFCVMAFTAPDARTVWLLAYGLAGNIISVGSGWIGARFAA